MNLAYCPAADVYWRDELDVVMLIRPRGALRLTGQGADLWRMLAAADGVAPADKPDPSFLESLIAALVSGGVLITGKDSERWQTSNVQHLPRAA